MKIIVQRKDTGEFYHRENRWTRHKHEAHDFATRQMAEDFCRDAAVDGCKIIVHLRQGVADVYMPCQSAKEL